MSKDYNAFEKYGLAQKGTLHHSYAPTEIDVLTARKVVRVLLWSTAALVAGGLYAFFVFAPAMFFTIMPVLGVVVAAIVGAYGLILLVKLIVETCSVFSDARNYGVAEDE